MAYGTVLVHINEDECIGCEECALACPNGAISVPMGGAAQWNATACNSCSQCAEACDHGALEIDYRD